MLRRPRLLIAALLGLSCWAPVAEAQHSDYYLYPAAPGAGAPSGVTPRDLTTLSERLWACYGAELTGDAMPDWARDELRLRVRFDRGRLTGVRVSRQARVPAGVRSCIEGLRLPAPAGGSRPTGTWVQTYELRRIIERVIRGSASLRGVTVEGRPSVAGALRAQLADLAPRLRHAYGRAMRRDPGLAGVIEARFEVTPEGRVSNLRVRASEGASADLSPVVRSTLERTRFRLPERDSARVRITVAFTPGL